ncbi:ATP-dependent DNA helicase PIF1-like protein, partial [Tanacetum coccineum]
MGTSKTKKKDLCSVSKTPTWNLIDQETDEEFTENDEHTSPFDKKNVLPITNKKPYGKDLQNTGNWTLEIYLTRKLMMIRIQKGIYSTVMDAVANNTGGMFFVYGYGGTGKTYLYKKMSAALHSQGEIVLNVASSGIAALLLEGGRTAHSRFAIPINILEDSMCHIPADSQLADLIRKAKLIIWDEAPMIQSYCYEAFDRTLRDICRSDPSEPSNRVFGVMNLKVNMRLGTGKTESEKKEIQEFADWILNIRNGNIDSKNVGESTIEFPDEMIIPESDDYVGSIIAETYPKL